MARSRARRRRQGIVLLIAIAVTAGAVVFARDIQRFAHGTPTQQRSQNLTFGALSTVILDDENQWGAAVGQVVATGSTMTRTELANALSQAQLTGGQLLSRVSSLSAPPIHGAVQDVLIAVTTQRVSAIDHLIGAIEGPLELPGAGPGAPIPAIQHAIVASNESWRQVRLSLLYEPGAVVLARSRLDLGVAPLAAEVDALLTAPSLRPVRKVEVAAVAVTPPPLPAPTGQLRLVPTSQIRVGVSVLNLEWIDETVTVTVTIRPTNGIGRVVSDSQSTSLAPRGAAAVTMRSLAVAPSERAEMTVAISGAPTTGTRTFAVTVAT